MVHLVQSFSSKPEEFISDHQCLDCIDFIRSFYVFDPVQTVVTNSVSFPSYVQVYIVRGGVRVRIREQRKIKRRSKAQLSL